jgi:putative transcriptional regulator|nr:MAG TPA: putative transcriptional regulator [Caudoviricetes sp.]
MCNPRTYFKKARLSSSLTQRKLAELSGVTETTIRNIEANRVDPSLKLAINITKVLGAEFEEIWKNDFE